MAANPGEYEVTVMDDKLIMYHVMCGQQIRPRVPLTIVDLRNLANYHESADGTCTEKKAVPA